MQKNCLTFIILSMFAMIVHADETNVVDEEKSWGMDISLERNHQKFDDTSATQGTFSLTPYYTFQHFSVSLNVPWYKMSNEYVVTNNTTQTQTRLCDTVSQLTTLQIQFLINHNRLTQAQVDKCSTSVSASSIDEETQSGMGDVSLYTNYYLPLDEAGIWSANLGLSYKFNNGDAETGLGTGATETSAEASLGASIGQFNSDLLLGHTVVGNDDSQLLNDYSYSRVGVSYVFFDQLTLGDHLDFQESSIDGNDDIHSNSVYIRYSLTHDWNVSAYLTRYINLEDYPNREAGFGITYSL